MLFSVKDLFEKVAVILLAVVFGLCGNFFIAQEILAKSAFSPRHTGMEPPGGPRPLEGVPGRAPSRTAEGGMGYKDAYGNTVTDQQNRDKPARQRIRPGAYGNQEKSGVATLPEVDAGSPVWNFNK